ncbi:MAG: recombination-associated protein RdgC [Nevskia sp.]|nr:recombination-associated protein RdgC [Nevskia sp.]
MSIWFKNLSIFSLPPGWKPTPGKLEETLSAHPLLPCNAASMQSQGWVPPLPSSGLVYSQGKQMLIALGTQQRLLPASVIRQVVKERAAALEKKQGFAPGRKQLRDLKDQVADELRPRAFVRERTVRAWVDLTQHRLVVDTSSPKVAENLTSVLRNDLGELAAVPLETQKSAGKTMTAWLAAGKVSGKFGLDQDCELVGNELSKAAVRYVRHGLDGAEIRSLIGGGKTASRVGLVWRDRIALVLTDKLTLRRLRFEAIEAQKQDEAAAGSKSAKDAEDQSEADFTLMTGELGALIDELAGELGGVKRD